MLLRLEDASIYAGRFKTTNMIQVCVIAFSKRIIMSPHLTIVFIQCQRPSNTSDDGTWKCWNNTRYRIIFCVVFTIAFVYIHDVYATWPVRLSAQKLHQVF